MRIAIGLSGGVDSSTAALLLQAQGHTVIGMTMKLWNGRYKGGERAACFGAHEERNIAAAEAFARAHGIEYHVFDCSSEYDQMVIANFRETYLEGKTPNPCVRCNALIKFGLLPDLARRSGVIFDRFATGHYARIEKVANGRLAIRRALDETKDQSYFLYRLSQEQLQQHLFPLGDMRKCEVRAKAAELGLAAADRPDSQDFYSGDVAELIGAPEQPGKIVNLQGEVVGTHSGFWNYTIGQRKGLRIGGAPEPYYVVDLNGCRNEVIVGRVSETISRELLISDVVYGAISENEHLSGSPITCWVKIRSTGIPRGPVVLNGMSCLIPDGFSGIAPGQSAVFYDAEGHILLGGIIQK